MSQLDSKTNIKMIVGIVLILITPIVIWQFGHDADTFFMLFFLSPFPIGLGIFLLIDYRQKKSSSDVRKSFFEGDVLLSRIVIVIAVGLLLLVAAGFMFLLLLGLGSWSL